MRCMNKADAIKFFGTQVKLAALLGTTQSTVSGWGDYPPPLRQLQIEQLSGGALKAEKNILPRRTSKHMRAAQSVKV